MRWLVRFLISFTLFSAAACVAIMFLFTSAASPAACYEPVPGLPVLETGLPACPQPDRAKPRPFWQRCKTGRACAVAVLPHFFRDWRYALSIVRCETGRTWSNRALGAAGERSWFQIHPWWWRAYRWIREDRLWDVRYNAAVARWIVNRKGGWSHWTCARYVRASWSN